MIRRERMSEYAKQRRRERIDAGLCTRCGNAPAAQGYRTCDDCRAYYRRLNAERRSDFKTLGLCQRDGKPVNPGYTLCPNCLRLDQARLAKRAEAADAEGLCRICRRKPQRKGYTRCEDCAARDRARHHQRKPRRCEGAAPLQRPLCSWCEISEAMNDSEWCQECAADFEAWSTE